MNQNLNDLIIQAQGDRSQNLFASQCGISPSTLTRIINGEFTPSPKILKKIASKALNNVTYFDLMKSCNYDIPKPEILIPEEYKDIPVAFFNGVKNLTHEDINDVIKFMEYLKSKK